MFDDYVMLTLQRVVSNALRPEDRRDPHVETEVRAALDKSYAWLEPLDDRPHVGGERDVLHRRLRGGRQPLFYAHWAFPIPASHTALNGYRARLRARARQLRV